MRLTHAIISLVLSARSPVHLPALFAGVHGRKTAVKGPEN